jgi:hypothetical protein
MGLCNLLVNLSNSMSFIAQDSKVFKTKQI